MEAGNRKTDRDASKLSVASGLISEEYRELLRKAHAEPEWGTSALNHLQLVCDAIAKSEAKTVLDYGCGKGVLSEYLEVTNYDPATFPELPEPHDLVLCIDVMEHVEPESVDAVLDHIRELAKKGALFVISCRPAIKKLADGRNAHITICPPGWWVNEIKKRGFEIVQEIRSDADTEVMVFAKSP